jgi:hypothetical protein
MDMMSESVEQRSGQPIADMSTDRICKMFAIVTKPQSDRRRTTTAFGAKADETTDEGDEVTVIVFDVRQSCVSEHLLMPLSTTPRTTRRRTFWYPKLDCRQVASYEFGTVVVPIVESTNWLACEIGAEFKSS